MMTTWSLFFLPHTPYPVTYHLKTINSKKCSNVNNERRKTKIKEILKIIPEKGRTYEKYFKIGQQRESRGINNFMVP
jgi:hypothetical protein